MTSSALPSHVACPACQQVTPLPAQVAPTAVVRCPHCQAQFALHDLLGDPEVVWQLVSDPELQAHEQQGPESLLAEPQTTVGERRQPDDPDAETGEAEASSVESEQLHDDEYTYDVAATEMPQAVSPGAETVVMSGYEELVESWKDNSLEGELADDPAESDLEESPPRKLEGPLVGEFPDDPEDDEYPAWCPLAAQASDDQTHREGSAVVETFVEDMDNQPGFTPSSSRPVSSGFAARRNLPRRSPVWSILQVALGGLAAIPVSLLLMWHLLGTDIGNAAPWVAQYAPWIVPQKFRPYAQSSSPAAANPQSDSAADASEPLPRFPAPGPAADETALAEEHPADEIPTVQPRSLSDVDLPTDSLDAAPDTVSGDSQTQDSLSAESTLVRSQPPSGAQGGASSNAAEMANSTDTSGDLMDGFELDSQSLSNMLDGLEPQETELDNSSDSAASADTHLANNSPQMPPDDLDSAALENCFTLIRETDMMLEEWSLAVSAKQHDTALAQDTYSELASLALAVDRLPPRDLVQQAMRLQLKPVRRQVEQKLEVRNLIDQGARFWIRSQSQRTREADTGSTGDDAAEPSGDSRYGLAVTAVVDSVTPSPDGLWSTVIASATTHSGGTVKLPLDLQIPQELISLLPEGELSVGQKLFLLGTVKRPTEVVSDDASSAAGQPLLIANYLAPL